MPELRRNHQRTKNPFTGLMLRVFVMMGILGVMFVVLWRYLGTSQPESKVVDVSTVSVSGMNYDDSSETLLVVGRPVEVVEHDYYTLGYVEKYEQAAWVSYSLTKESLRIPNVERADRFEEDPQVSTGSADYYDYRGSGYSRGHMAPAGDMAFSKEAMKQSFYMSNMSPQKIPFNGGIWRELEETVRDWAYKYGEVQVVTGPVLDGIDEFIGDAEVGVPSYFYKVIYRDNPSPESIGFLMPNEVSKRPIMDYAVTVDDVEQRTGLDFYRGLLDETTELKVEESIDINLWPVSMKRYQNRINHWNKR
ncbi:MAG: DNA/RNA non-specific endonuclease [Bacteroidota bacterium]